MLYSNFVPLTICLPPNVELSQLTTLMTSIVSKQLSFFFLLSAIRPVTKQCFSLSKEEYLKNMFAIDRRWDKPQKNTKISNGNCGRDKLRRTRLFSGKISQRWMDRDFHSWPLRRSEDCDQNKKWLGKVATRKWIINKLLPDQLKNQCTTIAIKHVLSGRQNKEYYLRNSSRGTSN